ncbi:hypothetical protein SAMN03159341_10917 [Paenibacillus sp. 1_12]|uniref:hypothetical protein n=1 Tax=Paenibacillus sp. 1_12 TaxID=1566278 RepID=UPI0008ECCC92|nr:hypothetical protein [Paenibacillus sp. 1_12]SFL72526.1 hypothetical protein SAMN03159341_10917 [Paenibacillus sp. 1_12]
MNFINRSSARILINYVIVTVLLLSVVSAACEAAPLRSNQMKATWLWDTSLISTLENRQAVLKFAKEQSVGRIYLQVNPDAAKSTYRAFIQAAAKAGIQIHALDGAPNWIHSDQHQQILNMVKWVKDYNASVLKDERFTGIQVDIEPYVLPEWHDERDVTVINWINAMTLFTKEVKQDSTLTASAALPFWLQLISVPDDSSLRLNEKLFNLLDEVTLMSYRDQAQALIEITAADVALADRLNKKVFVGVETNPSSEAAFVSFYEEGRAAMNKQLTLVDAALKGHPSYAGIAIHDYTGWKNLKP